MNEAAFRGAQRKHISVAALSASCALDMEHQFANSLLFDVSYVGNKAVDVEVTRNINPLPNQYLSTSNTRDTGLNNYRTAQVTNPFYGLMPQGHRDLIDGQIQTETFHQAYCPVMNSMFIQESTYDHAPLTAIRAYYYYTNTTNEGMGIYRRCNPIGTTCDYTNIKLGPGVWQFGLFRGAEIHILNTAICAMAQEEQVDRCYSPDPQPGGGGVGRNRLKKEDPFHSSHTEETAANSPSCGGCARSRLSPVSKRYH